MKRFAAATGSVLAAAALAATLASAGAPAHRAKTIQFSKAWQNLVISGTKPGSFHNPVVVSPSAPLPLYWNHEVAGRLQLTFGSVAPGTVISVSFSETSEYLRLDTSDFSRTYPTDRHAPVSSETWTDTPGCQAPGVCADGYRAFRLAEISAVSGSATVTGVSVQPGPNAGTTPKSWFLSSDQMLNRAWYASAYTAQLMIMPNNPAILDVRGCPMAGPPTMLVVVDGAKRDRCPWIEPVTPLTLLLIGDNPGDALRNTLAAYAALQRPDGYIPPSPDGALPRQRFYDLPAYFVSMFDEMLLYQGKPQSLAAFYPNVVKLMDRWYPSTLGSNGLVRSPGGADYAFIGRHGAEIAYFNGLYAATLQHAAEIADTLGHPNDAARWQARARALAGAFNATFWDGTAGAYVDSPIGTPVHALDGNAFAIQAGLASDAQIASAFAYVNAAMTRPWGTGIADNDTWYYPEWGPAPSQRVYPLISYFWILDEFDHGQTQAAIDQLRATWGWMLNGNNQPTRTTWESIGQNGWIDGVQGKFTSMAHGWSSGAAPALSNEVLGVKPTSAGFATFDAIPHPGDLRWAQGGVPTPQGAIKFAWEREAHGYLLRLVAPNGLAARVGVPATAAAKVFVDGKATRATVAGGNVTVNLHGSHVVEVVTR